MSKQEDPKGSREIDTGGGAYIEGKVNTGGGDFIGRDQFKSSGLSAAEVARLFADIHAAIEAKAALSQTEKTDLKAEVEEVKAEAHKGEKAEPSFLERRLRNIGRMAPDILEVVLATLASPAAGFAAAVRKIAEKVKAEAGS